MKRLLPLFILTSFLFGQGNVEEIMIAKIDSAFIQYNNDYDLRRNTRDKFYSYKNLSDYLSTEEKLQKVIKKYFPTLKKEDVLLFFYDGGFLGGGGTFIVTRDKLYIYEKYIVDWVELEFDPNGIDYEYVTIKEDIGSNKKDGINLYAISFEKKISASTKNPVINVYKDEKLVGQIYPYREVIEAIYPLLKEIEFIQSPARLILYKTAYFLEDLDRLDLLTNKSNLIKEELGKIEDKFRKATEIKYFTETIQKAVKKRVITSSSMSDRNKDILFQATLQNPNMTEYEYNYLKQELSQNTYETRETSPKKVIQKNKSIKLDEDIYSIKPEWENVVTFYGGYSGLVSNNISKENYDRGAYDAKVKLVRIEFLNSNECLAVVDISGELELNNISKNQYKYMGTYKIEDFDIYDIYHKKMPKLIFTFENKKYLGSLKSWDMPINRLSDSKISFDSYISTIDLMIGDFISDEDYIKVITKRN